MRPKEDSIDGSTLDTLGSFFGQEIVNAPLKNDHPLAWMLLNRAPWTRQWLAWFAQSARDLSATQGFEGLLARLRDPRLYGEAISVFRVGARLFRSGFTVAFDQPIAVSGQDKRPDLRLAIQGESDWAYGEVTVLHTSQETLQAEATSQAICDAIIGASPELIHACRIIRPLAKPHLRQVVEEVRKVATRARVTGKLQSYFKEGVLQLGVAPVEDQAGLEAWASQTGNVTHCIEGPPIRTDEPRRTKHRVANKAKQIPSGHHNVLFVESPSLLYSGYGITELMRELAEGVFEYPHVGGLVVTQMHLGGDAEANVSQAGNKYLRRVSHELLIEHHLIMFNEYADPLLPEAWAKCLESSFGTPF